MPEKKRRTYHTGADDERHQILDKVKAMLAAPMLTTDAQAALLELQRWIGGRVGRNKSRKGGL